MQTVRHNADKHSCLSLLKSACLLDFIHPYSRLVFFTGNNVFARDIPPVLEEMKDTEERTAWIAMDRLCPVISQNYMVRSDQQVHIQDVNSELGIFGAILGYYHSRFFKRKI